MRRRSAERTIAVDASAFGGWMLSSLGGVQLSVHYRNGVWISAPITSPSTAVGGEGFVLTRRRILKPLT